MKPFELRVPTACRGSVGCWRPLAAALCALLALVPPLIAQTPNPVPFVNQPLVPAAVEPGGPDFTVTLRGTGFVPESVVKWNGNARRATFISSTQIYATIPASDIATPGTAWVTVANPAPGGGTSNLAFFHVTYPTTSVSMSKTDYAAGTDPRSVATQDFNGDSKLDLAVTNSGDNTVSILLGNGDGTFQTQTTFGTGVQPFSVTTGDFNEDGKLDLALANIARGTGTTVSILLGNGDGTFQTQSTSSTGVGPRSVTTGDFNADGKLDLATAGEYSSTVSILLGNGDGTFQTQSTFATGANPFSVTTGDFNGDGKLDLAVANAGDKTVSILLGNGDGTFQTQSTFATRLHTFSVTTGDFNGDGRLDLAVANFDSDKVSVLLQPAPASPPFTVGIDIKPGDANNTINLKSGGVVSVAILGSATFDPLTVDPETVTLAGAHVATRGRGAPMTSARDTNHDGYPDLLLFFRTQDLGLTPASTQAVLYGETFSGQRIRGTDSVRLVPPALSPRAIPNRSIERRNSHSLSRRF